jgi:hypothetical protein
VRALELFVRPPLFALAIARDRFGKDLTAIGSECLDVDIAGFDRSKTPATGFVA